MLLDQRRYSERARVWFALGDFVESMAIEGESDINLSLPGWNLPSAAANVTRNCVSNLPDVAAPKVGEVWRTFYLKNEALLHDSPVR